MLYLVSHYTEICLKNTGEPFSGQIYMDWGVESLSEPNMEESLSQFSP